MKKRIRIDPSIKFHIRIRLSRKMDPDPNQFLSKNFKLFSFNLKLLKLIFEYCLSKILILDGFKILMFRPDPTFYFKNRIGIRPPFKSDSDPTSFQFSFWFLYFVPVCTLQLSVCLCMSMFEYNIDNQL